MNVIGSAAYSGIGSVVREFQTRVENAGRVGGFRGMCVLLSNPVSRATLGDTFANFKVATAKKDQDSVDPLRQRRKFIRGDVRVGEAGAAISSGGRKRSNALSGVRAFDSGFSGEKPLFASRYLAVAREAEARQKSAEALKMSAPDGKNPLRAGGWLTGGAVRTGEFGSGFSFEKPLVASSDVAEAREKRAEARQMSLDDLIGTVTSGPEKGAHIKARDFRKAFRPSETYLAAHPGIKEAIEDEELADVFARGKNNPEPTSAMKAEPGGSLKEVVNTSKREQEARAVSPRNGPRVIISEAYIKGLQTLQGANAARANAARATKLASVSGSKLSQIKRIGSGSGASDASGVSTGS